MALALFGLGLLCLAFIAWLTIDGLGAIWRRRRAERVRRPLELRVIGRREVAGELLCLELAEASGKALPGFTAGQHLLLSAPAGKHGKTIQRAYSLAAWQKRPGCYELGIKREEQGAMSQWLWQNLPEASTLMASPPRGEFVVAPGAETLVLIGGGIGITPMRAMLHEALASGRLIVLFHGARTAEALLYRPEFATLAERHAQLTYRPFVSRPDADWPGERGRLSAERILAGLGDADSADFYLCAGNEMMAELRAALAAQGIAAARIHWEAFGVAASAGVGGLHVTVSQQGREASIQTAGEPTLLAALEANDIPVRAECRAGSCGQCLARLDDGEVEWLATPEFTVKDLHILPCICSARTDLSISVA